ncbi:MAG TPA: DUF2071 domain-containing protein [Vicinamibacteria bacterium]|nr:DUF2071 domain-containing protein [Vicinamibacteria bacterium]
MDRIAPTRRPGRRALMHQRWRELGFLHWPVDTAAVQARLPPGLTVDTFDGQAWVGVVPFRVEGARVASLPPMPGTSHFLEINTRTYVHREGRDPGVWFFSLDANHRLIVAVARALFHLAYRRAVIDMETAGVTTFEGGRLGAGGSGDAPRWRIRYRGLGAPGPAAPGTLEHFLTERYVLYASAGERLYLGRVHHAPYPLQRGEAEVTESLVAAAGLARPDSAPLVHYAAGVDVEIFALQRL